MADSLKICKMLKDMLNQLAIECDMREDLARKLQIVGCFMEQIEFRKVREVAGRLTKSKPLALVLKEILYVKSIIIQPLDVINEKNDVDIENFLYDSDEQDKYYMPPTINISKTIVTPRWYKLYSFNETVDSVSAY
ncbi:11877_t:CDS:2 [Dentiscutata erythropus]|uniref:11877_t:CDS:1 n=1 Tax=Dentiscutata erythropus TaxID=1348616 RepID=A0A9N9P792_9GLOM|nr:11877_t:CDS:2 [Dentiscutata erythropus]